MPELEFSLQALWELASSHVRPERGGIWTLFATSSTVWRR